MAANVGPSRGVKSEINVTPLVDVVLVLLIIFMVVTPMLQRGKDVQLPPAGKQEEAAQNDPVVVSVQYDKALFWESSAIREAELATRVRGAGSRRILLKADARLSVGDVRRVMHALHVAGARAVSLAVQEEAR